METVFLRSKYATRTLIHLLWLKGTLLMGAGQDSESLLLLSLHFRSKKVDFLTILGTVFAFFIVICNKMRRIGVFKLHLSTLAVKKWVFFIIWTQSNAKTAGICIWITLVYWILVVKPTEPTENTSQIIKLSILHVHKKMIWVEIINMVMTYQYGIS